MSRNLRWYWVKSTRAPNGKNGRRARFYARRRVERVRRREQFATLIAGSFAYAAEGYKQAMERAIAKGQTIFIARDIFLEVSAGVDLTNEAREQLIRGELGRIEG